jgi:hypothetical protein
MTESIAYRFENGTMPKELLPVRDISDAEIETLAGSIFTEDQTYQYSDVYKFAKALLQKAREK